ncbi:MAG TPA: DUF2330 domain-containing protein [Kofleriaceae bacterium]|nr:DUF2330 domain-containing protein [Kofleriaceae bacterium]
MLVTLAIARVLAEGGAPPPDLSEDAILLVKRTAQVGEICDGMVGPDGGLPDGGVPVDGGVPDGGVPLDGGVSVDGGVPLDGGVPDGGGLPGDGGVPDGGFCIPVSGDVISLVVQPRFMTSPGGGRFALLFVTPSRPVVQTHEANVFANLAEVTKPRVEVTRIEVPDPALGKKCDYGCSMSWETGDPPPAWWTEFPDAGVPDDAGGPPGIETVGPYEVVRAQPASAAELSAWLDGLGYTYQQDDLDATAPYIERGYTVVALRVAVDEASAPALAPIALTWQGSELRLPAAFGIPDAAGATSVYIAADQRYDLDGAEVAFSARTNYSPSGWLTRNDLVLASDSPDEDPVAHAAGTTEKIEVEYVEERVRVPVNDCEDELGCCGACSSRRGPSPTSIGGLLAVAFLIGRKRRPRRV